MRKIELYKYTEDKKVIITPKKKNETDEPALYRLIADKDKKLKSGDKYSSMVDTYAPDEWKEITKEEYAAIIEQKKE